MNRDEGKVTVDTMTSWRTDDLSLASYLELEGEVMIGLEWNHDSCYFIFKQSENLVRLSSGFLSGEAQTDPRAYSITMSSVKRTMFNSRKNGENPMFVRLSATQRGFAAAVAKKQGLSSPVEACHRGMDSYFGQVLNA